MSILPTSQMSTLVAGSKLYLPWLANKLQFSTDFGILTSNITSSSCIIQLIFRIFCLNVNWFLNKKYSCTELFMVLINFEIINFKLQKFLTYSFAHTLLGAYGKIEFATVPFFYCNIMSNVQRNRNQTIKKQCK